MLIRLAFILAAFSSTASAQNQGRRDTSPYKGYSGFRLNDKAFRMVYHHDQTIAVVEIGTGRVLLNCEIIEIYNENQGREALKNLSKTVSKPYELKFEEMMELMTECDKLQPTPQLRLFLNSRPAVIKEGNGASTITSGILPGTKWCGTGDVADTYFDLGDERIMDMCCRKHDLCPIKVRAYSNRYNLSNKSLYTKSHCVCDDEFAKCLKSTGRTPANFMGNIYFNILRVPCIQEGADGKKKFRSASTY